MSALTVPDAFVWSRIGPESGETLEEVIQRKERQRAVNGAVFVWGIGHSLQSGVRRLLEYEPEPRVLFTRIQGKGEPIDRKPDGLFLWRGYYCAGELRSLPRGAIVVSRSRTRLGMKNRHYALFCESSAPLSLATRNGFRRDAVVNIESGRPVGASQTTAVVRHIGGGSAAFAQVALDVQLVPPYSAQLADPVAVTAEALVRAYKSDDWIEAVAELEQ